MPQYKFEIGDVVMKSKGYRYVGRVVSRYKVEGGIRYDVQVDPMVFAEKVGELSITYRMSERHERFLREIVTNCNGMIHIFAEEQLELYIE